MTREDDEIERIVEELRQVHIDRRRLSAKEQCLIGQLVEARTSESAGLKRLRTNSPKKTKQEHGDIISARRQNCQTAKTDRYGNDLSVGDRVEVLTQGRTAGKNWIIYKLTDKRVLLERNNGVYKTHREYKNVRRLD